MSRPFSSRQRAVVRVMMARGPAPTRAWVRAGHLHRTLRSLERRGVVARHPTAGWHLTEHGWALARLLEAGDPVAA